MRAKVVHTHDSEFFHHVHIVLVRPEEPRNVGSVARAMANMGVRTPLRIVSGPGVVTEEARRLARHANFILDSCQFYGDFEGVTRESFGARALLIAVTARVGSAARPHPSWLHEAIPKALLKLTSAEITDLVLVFGPESDGLDNQEVRSCDRVMGIASDAQYSSLNLAQAVMVCCYEFRRYFLLRHRGSVWRGAAVDKPSQKERLVAHLLEVAEAVGFILPGDPLKMRPRLEQVFSGLPNHMKDIKTLHGLLDQVARSVSLGRPDIRGRYRRLLGEGAEIG